MSISWRWWLVVPAVLAGMLLAACGDDNGEPSDTGPSDEAAETAEPAEDGMVDEEEPADEDGGVEAGGDAFEDVPVPSGANETASGQWSGSIPGLVPGQGTDPEQFTSLEFKEYEVDDSPSEIIDFYRGELSGWDEGFVFSGGEAGDEGGVGVWTRDDGRVAIWISANASDGGSDLVVIRGAAE